MQAHPEKFKFSVSYTTRSPRAGETPGQSYHYVDRDVFNAMIDDNKFVEHAEFSGNLYGTPFSALEDGTGDGRRVILDLEVEGVKALKESGRAGLFVFIAPPSLPILRSRLESRNSETPESLSARLAAAESAMTYAESVPCPYDAVIVNGDDVDGAARLLELAILGKEGVEEGGGGAQVVVTDLPIAVGGNKAEGTGGEGTVLVTQTLVLDGVHPTPAAGEASVVSQPPLDASTADAVPPAPVAATDGKKKSKTCSIL
ncbi:hypothetical protein HKX48_007880 [Thoreauomyces humboldtii]|nr:hypothetical protein HKX48_007880 [Thoreauomyces humboldtii]